MADEYQPQSMVDVLLDQRCAVASQHDDPCQGPRPIGGGKVRRCWECGVFEDGIHAALDALQTFDPDAALLDRTTGDADCG